MALVVVVVVVVVAVVAACGVCVGGATLQGQGKLEVHSHIRHGPFRDLAAITAHAHERLLDVTTKTWMNGWMHEWMDGCMDVWMGEWMGEWMDGWTDGRMNYMYRWMNE